MTEDHDAVLLLPVGDGYELGRPTNRAGFTAALAGGPLAGAACNYERVHIR